MLINIVDKNINFDLFLFLGVVVLKVSIPAVKGYIFSEPFIEESNFELLTGGKIFVLLILAPVVEEFIFRGVFVIPSSRFFAVFYSLGLVFLIYYIISYILNMNDYVNIAYFLLGGAALIILVYFWYADLVAFIVKHPLPIILITAILFSLAHINNYDTINLAAYMGLLPRLVAGLFLGYVAFKYGLAYSILCHLLFNFIPIACVFAYKSFL